MKPLREDKKLKYGKVYGGLCAISSIKSVRKIFAEIEEEASR